MFQSAFYGSIGIGTPAQEAVKIKLDTGSFELVAGYSESPHKSSTYLTQNEPFKEFEWTGVRATDTITFGGLLVRNQTFSQATNDVTWGLMGLSCINNDRQDLLLPNMFRQGLIPQPVFGLYLNT